jgi:hypothetical protein
MAIRPPKTPPDILHIVAIAGKDHNIWHMLEPQKMHLTKNPYPYKIGV